MLNSGSQIVQYFFGKDMVEWDKINCISFLD